MKEFDKHVQSRLETIEGLLLLAGEISLKMAASNEKLEKNMDKIFSKMSAKLDQDMAYTF